MFDHNFAIFEGFLLYMQEKVNKKSYQEEVSVKPWVPTCFPANKFNKWHCGSHAQRVWTSSGAGSG